MGDFGFMFVCDENGSQCEKKKGKKKYLFTVSGYEVNVLPLISHPPSYSSPNTRSWEG